MSKIKFKKSCLQNVKNKSCRNSFKSRQKSIQKESKGLSKIRVVKNHLKGVVKIPSFKKTNNKLNLIHVLVCKLGLMCCIFNEFRKCHSKNLIVLSFKEIWRRIRNFEYIPILMMSKIRINTKKGVHKIRILWVAY